MKLFIRALFLLSLTIGGHPAAAESLGFVAQVENENLAEEAILLTHCLATRTGRSWQLDGETQGDHWVKYVESEKRLKGTYRSGTKEKSFDLRLGEADRVCETLEPALATPETASLLAPSANLSSARASLAELPPEAEDAALNDAGHSGTTWLWAGIAGAAVAGFFIFRGHSPTHSALQMN